VIDNNLKMVDFFYSRGCDLNSLIDNYPLVSYSAKNGFREIFYFLIEKGANLNDRSESLSFSYIILMLWLLHH